MTLSWAYVNYVRQTDLSSNKRMRRNHYQFRKYIWRIKSVTLMFHVDRRSNIRAWSRRLSSMIAVSGSHVEQPMVIHINYEECTVTTVVARADSQTSQNARELFALGMCSTRPPDIIDRCRSQNRVAIRRSSADLKSISTDRISTIIQANNSFFYISSRPAGVIQRDFEQN